MFLTEESMNSILVLLLNVMGAVNCGAHRFIANSLLVKSTEPEVTGYKEIYFVQNISEGISAL
jgi:hypothetical protein